MDLISRVIAICSIGTQEDDPIVCLLEGFNEIHHLVIPHKRKRLVK